MRPAARVLVRVAVGLVATQHGIHAQQVGVPVGVPLGTIEAGVAAAQVTQAFGNWRSAYARAALRLDPSTILFPEIVASQEFHDRGTLVGLGATRTLNEDWYAFGAVSTSAGGFYLPRVRAALQLNRKLLASRSLVVNAGVSYIAAKDEHRDEALSLGAAYYFAAPWIIEAGTSLNRSRPGNVRSQSTFGAITEGREGKHFIILRVGGGNEAYQIIAPGSAVSDFESSVASLTWRQWVKNGAGFVVGAERYGNPFYHRTGISLGGFWNIK